MRSPKAVGSSIQILPVPPEIQMTCAGKGACELIDVEALGVQEVVKKVLKNTKVRSFDGYISFEEERGAWMFLESVGRVVKGEAKKMKS